ncbi:MAG: cyanophycinase [Gemmataceae bacterium]
MPAPILLASEANAAVFARFVELAGGKKARLLVVAGQGSEKEWATRFAPAEVRLHRPGTSLPDLKGMTGIWFDTLPPGAMTPPSLPLAMGCAGPAISELGRLIPDAVVSRSEQARFPLEGQVAFEVSPGAALVVQGRELSVSGSGKVTIRLAPGPSRAARAIDLSGKQVEDLTALRRAARDRRENFPPRQVGTPVVPQGTLVIVGGGGMPSGLLERFVTLAGGKNAKIVVLPTAVPPLPMLRDRMPEVMRKLGAQVTVLPGITREVVESPEYLTAMREATGIWFGGGRQWRFVDSYEGTALLPLMHDVLKRGGVIGGSSAGATIQGDYLCRGGVFTNFDPAYEGYERGFAFLPGVAIDQHFAQRKRFTDMTALMKLIPQYLGIGLDEATAIIVQGSRAEVVGKHQVHFYDASRPPEKGKPDHVSLSAGQRYDLQARRILADKEK